VLCSALGLSSVCKILLISDASFILLVYTPTSQTRLPKQLPDHTNSKLHELSAFSIIRGGPARLLIIPMVSYILLGTRRHEELRVIWIRWVFLARGLVLRVTDNAVHLLASAIFFSHKASLLFTEASQIWNHVVVFQGLQPNT
jgi:hypothetical protein